MQKILAQTIYRISHNFIEKDEERAWPVVFWIWGNTIASTCVFSAISRWLQGFYCEVWRVSSDFSYDKHVIWAGSHSVIGNHSRLKRATYKTGFYQAAPLYSKLNPQFTYTEKTAVAVYKALEQSKQLIFAGTFQR